MFFSFGGEVPSTPSASLMETALQGLDDIPEELLADSSDFGDTFTDDEGNEYPNVRPTVPIHGASLSVLFLLLLLLLLLRQRKLSACLKDILHW